MEPFGVSENGKYTQESGMNTETLTFYYIHNPRSTIRNPQSLIFNFPRQWKELRCPSNVYT
jgi:hypothetical protein